MENCLECGEKIIGRSDKKFCNDACRNSYNNKQNKTDSAIVKNINAILKKNYRIASQFKFTDGKCTISKTRLALTQFDYNYFTNIKVYKNGAEYRFIYDIGYRVLEDDRVLFVKKENNPQ